MLLRTVTIAVIALFLHACASRPTDQSTTEPVDTPGVKSSTAEAVDSTPIPAPRPAPIATVSTPPEYRGVLIELRGEAAVACARGDERVGSAYIDIMGSGDLVWDDKLVTAADLAAHLNRASANGLQCVTTRVVDGAPADAIPAVRRMADDAGIPTVEVVRIPLR